MVWLKICTLGKQARMHMEDLVWAPSLRTLILAIFLMFVCFFS